MSYRRKLIEVALPLEAINKEAAREKSIRHGHPSTLHLWWARRPLAACRAVLFSSLVDDPDEPQAPAEYLAQLDALEYPGDRREKLFAFIEDLVKWENTNDERIMGTAHQLILAATEGNPPPVLDPFCGGGSIPLEAQRLGLEAHGSDLNPVAVLITKALIEIPPKFAGMPPVNPEAQKSRDLSTWKGAQGLAEDVRYYGQWMRDEAEKRIGYLYPKGPNGETVIAWLWARTVKCPNPACGAEMPLVRSFALSTKKSNEVSVQPVVDKQAKTVCFEVGEGAPMTEGTVKSRAVTCLVCGQQSGLANVRSEAQAGRMSAQLMAFVTSTRQGRQYHAGDSEQYSTAMSAPPAWGPDAEMSRHPQYMAPPRYGMVAFQDLFTARQLSLLTTINGLIDEARAKARSDAAAAAGRLDGGIRTQDSRRCEQEYADAVGTYLALVASKAAVFHTSLSRWRSGESKSAPGISRQAIPIVWDFAEVNPFAGAGGDLEGIVDGAAKVCASMPADVPGEATQANAESAGSDGEMLVSTDPPYYDNVPYADLSDYFYVWLRTSLCDTYPSLFGTVLVPKAEELVADSVRHGGRDAAQAYFEQGMGRVLQRLRRVQDAAYPLTVYYAFKQAEGEGEEGGNGLSHGQTVASTGWETFLHGLVQAGFLVVGTLPMQTEGRTRMRSLGSNALASSIILVCRPRPDDAPMATRREFLTAMKNELPHALRQLQKSNIAPVDLAQASIGPGMAVFSRYSKVLETDGTAMRVRTALALINQTLDEVLAEQEGEFDADTRWALAWFEQHGFTEGVFGDAETLSKAKNTSVHGMEEAGILSARAGKVRLLARTELRDDWDPVTDPRFTIWEATQYLIRALEQQGEMGAATLLRRLGSNGEVARDLAYRLYHICERKGWAQDAIGCNSLVVAWPEIQRLSAHLPETGADQQSLEM